MSINSCRSTDGLPGEPIVAGAVGEWLVAKSQMRGEDNRLPGRRLPGLTRENVEDRIGAAQPGIHRFGAGLPDRLDAMVPGGRQQRDHLSAAIVKTGQSLLRFAHRGRQNQFLERGAVPQSERGAVPQSERGAVPQSARFAFKNWHIMPGVVDRPVTSKDTVMLADDLAVLQEHDSGRVGAQLHRTPRFAVADTL